MQHFSLRWTEGIQTNEERKTSYTHSTPRHGPREDRPLLFDTQHTRTHTDSTVCLQQCVRAVPSAQNDRLSHKSHSRWTNLSQSRCACVEVRVKRFAPNVNVFACFANMCTGMFESERVCAGMCVCVWMQRRITSTVHIQSSSFWRVGFGSSRSIFWFTFYHSTKFLCAFVQYYLYISL